MLLTPNDDDRHGCASIAERLSEIAASVGDIIGGDLHGRIPGHDLWQYKALLDTGDDIYAVTLAAFWAIDELGRQPPKVRDIWPPGGHDTEDRLRIWAADPAGDGRPRWTIVSMAATAWCNSLEGFLRGLAETAIDPRAVRRVRAAFPDAGIEWDSLTSARTAITQRMIPSTKRKGQSIHYLEAVFGCEVHPLVGLTLQALISFRNTVIHPAGGRMHHEHRSHPCSDQWVSWSTAVHVLAGLVMKSLGERLDERRADGETISLTSRMDSQDESE